MSESAAGSFSKQFIGREDVAEVEMHRGQSGDGSNCILARKHHWYLSYLEGCYIALNMV